MPQLPNIAYFTLAADWVCEVPSPTTRNLDLGGKRTVYAREGVSYHWFFRPHRPIAGSILVARQGVGID